MGARCTLTERDAWSILTRARELSIAAVIDGRPLLRTMHAAPLDGRLVLHGAPRSAKSAWVGASVVASAEEVVARIPSWMRHPERACPATTFYRSAQVIGRMVPIEDPELRSRGLSALMAKLQPEGLHRPITSDDPMYRAALRGLGVWAVEPESISGVSKLGEHLRDPEVAGVLAGLWRRGDPGDLEAIEVISSAHPSRPRFWPVPGGLRPRCHPDASDVAASVALVRDQYWNTRFDDAILAEALRRSAWVGLSDGAQLIATARGVSDGAKRAWIYDVVVAPSHRGRGLGTILMSALLDHPAIRDVADVRLHTRDAMAFYQALGFVEVRRDRAGPQGPSPYPRSEMVRIATVRPADP